MRHKEFISEVEKQMREKFAPAVGKLLESKYDKNIEKLKSSAIMNAIRWNYYGTTNSDLILGNYESETAAIKTFISERTDFLSKALTPDNPEFGVNDSFSEQAKENFNKILSVFVDGIELFLYNFCKAFSIK